MKKPMKIKILLQKWVPYTVFNLAPQGSNVVVLLIPSAQSRYWQRDGAIPLKPELKKIKQFLMYLRIHMQISNILAHHTSASTYSCFSKPKVSPFNSSVNSHTRPKCHFFVLSQSSHFVNYLISETLAKIISTNKNF